MKSRYLLFCLAAVMYISCNDQSSLKKTLTTNCYWDISELNSVHPINSCYKFDVNGNCQFFYYNFYDKKRSDSVFVFDDDDVIIENSWLARKDSLRIRGSEYIVLKYSQDSVMIRNLVGDTTILIRNCKTRHPQIH